MGGGGGGGENGCYSVFNFRLLPLQIIIFISGAEQGRTSTLKKKFLLCCSF